MKISIAKLYRLEISIIWDLRKETNTLQKKIRLIEINHMFLNLMSRVYQIIVTTLEGQLQVWISKKPIYNKNSKFLNQEHRLKIHIKHGFSYASTLISNININHLKQNHFDEFALHSSNNFSLHYQGGLILLVFKDFFYPNL